MALVTRLLDADNEAPSRGAVKFFGFTICAVAVCAPFGIVIGENWHNNLAVQAVSRADGALMPWSSPELLALIGHRSLRAPPFHLDGSMLVWASAQSPGRFVATRSRLRGIRAQEDESFKFEDLSKKALENAKTVATEIGREVTGNSDYKVGDVSKKALENVKSIAAEVGKEITGNSDYNVGDISKAAIGATADKVNDICLPCIAKDVSSNITRIAAEVRAKADDYQFGDITRAAAAAAAQKAAFDIVKLMNAADAASKVSKGDESYELGDDQIISLVKSREFKQIVAYVVVRLVDIATRRALKFFRRFWPLFVFPGVLIAIVARSPLRI